MWDDGWHMILKAALMSILFRKSEAILRCWVTCLNLCVFRHVWACLSNLPAVLFFFVYDCLCWCQPSSNPSPSGHRPEVIGHSTHFLLRIWSVTQSLIHTDFDKAREQSSTISYTNTQVWFWIIYTVLTYAKTEICQQHCTYLASTFRSNKQN